MADPEAVGRAFLDYFYGLFSTNRAGLASLYQESSLLTFEGNKIQGQQAIIQKLTNMPFQNVAVQRDTVDVQPSISGGILIFVTGKLMPEGESIPLKFSQAFHLMPTPTSSFVVTNEILDKIALHLHCTASVGD
ncbi:Nuclear transport factor 2 [Tetrabaena socialis]|uniref:NTF2-related export protein n=1 Tax=Tetrabaena socialis TaxID=47790 RepID=A0A2J7ZL87_9CHLO|nr:Nuclear transport factor 2 [Tetrabaena socialis]|eukprot:PNH01021.1 Nuclear transport factor 2 [Tetrabaena socialis]